MTATTTRRRFLASATGLGALALGSAPWQSALAAGWPDRTITLIVPYSAGGPTDAVGRMVAKEAGTALKQTIVVDNKAGAGGTIGVNALVRSTADGYTFALVAPGPIAGMPNLTKVAYDLGEIDFLTLVARIPSVIVVNPASGIDSLKSLIAKAKADPGSLNYSSAGPGTTPHIGAELLKQQAGIDIVHVPYKGAAPAITALLSGEVQMAMVDLLPVLPHVEAGKLKVIAVAGSARAPQLPDTPTTAELGLPGVVMETNYGVIGPKGLPDDVRKRFRDAVINAVQSEAMKADLLKQGAVPVTSSPDEYRALMQREDAKWKQVIAKGHITLG